MCWGMRSYSYKMCTCLLYKVNIEMWRTAIYEWNVYLNNTWPTKETQREIYWILLLSEIRSLFSRDIITDNSSCCENHRCCFVGHHTPPPPPSSGWGEIVCRSLPLSLSSPFLSRLTFTHCCFFISLFSSAEERGPPEQHLAWGRQQRRLERWRRRWGTGMKTWD